MPREVDEVKESWYLLIRKKQQPRNVIHTSVGVVVGGDVVGGLKTVVSVQSAVKTPAEGPKNVTILVAGQLNAKVHDVGSLQ